MPFTQRENISHFLTACENPPFNLPSHDRFLTVDLYDEKDPAQVIQCLGAFSRVASSINPSRFPTAIGPKKGAPSPTRKVADGSPYATTTPLRTGREISNASQGSNDSKYTTRSPPSARTMSPTMTGGSTTSKTPDSTTRSPPNVSSWSKRTDQLGTAPAWNIHQYGYMGGASQGNQGVVFGAPRQITSAAVQVPSVAEKEQRLRQQQFEAEREAKQRKEEEEQRERERRAQREAEEEQARQEEQRRFDEETRKARQREQEDAERQRLEMEREREQLRQAREEELRAVERDKEERRRFEAQRRTEEDEARQLAEERARSNAYMSTPKVASSPSAESDRIKELERQLEEAKERERQYTQERDRKAQGASDFRPEKENPSFLSSPDNSFAEDYRHNLHKESTEAPQPLRQAHSGGPRPLPSPATKPAVAPKPRASPFARSTRAADPPRAEPQPQPAPKATADPPVDDTDPSQSSNARPPHVTRTDQYLASNPAPAEEKPATHFPNEMSMTSTSERDAEDSRRMAAQQKTKAAGWASKSLLEREMERERERQREWEENQLAKARASGSGLNSRGRLPKILLT